MTFKKILCPTDFSPSSQQALRLAARLSARDGAELIIVHAWSLPAVAYSFEAMYPPSAIQEIIDDAQKHLEEALAEACAVGATRVSTRLLRGTPWLEIVQTLEHDKCELCIMATHGRAGFSRVLLGSVAERVVRHAPCSVLAIHPGSERKSFARVLVPVDFSESSAYAIELARELVQPGGLITLLHVVELPVRYSRNFAVVEAERDLHLRAVDVLDQTARKLEKTVDARVEICSRIGAPGHETLEVIDNDNTLDLVVVGSQGRTGIKRALLGSVAEKVVRHAGRPVLVARKRG